MRLEKSRNSDISIQVIEYMDFVEAKVQLSTFYGNGLVLRVLGSVSGE